MRPWEVLDTAPVPDDDATLYLLGRGNEYSIHVDEYELMNNRESGSEQALADLACDRLANLDDARILVGGLGMGFTLAATLRRIGPQAHATVAELMPAVVKWNRELCGGASGHPLRDPRVEVAVADVCDVLDSDTPRWSAILLDVDNGPQAWTRPTNGWLYTKQGLLRAAESLIPGGVLAIWSSSADASFTRRLRKVGYDVDVVQWEDDARVSFGPHVLWMAIPTDRIKGHAV